MRHRLVVVFVLMVLVVGVPAAPASAWGFDAHKYIMDRAIALLPAPIRPFFERHRTTLVEHAIDPDTYRTVGWKEEPPRHFLDMDAYGRFPFGDLPHDYDAAVARYGEDFVIKNGTIPWRAEDIFTQLTDAFHQTSPWSRDNIVLLSAVLAHYASDACQPLHAAKNYDGQLTGQQGIHARFESELFGRFENRLTVAPAPLVRVDNPREFMFTTLTASFTFVEPILDADRAAASGRTLYDDEYFNAFFPKVRPVLEKRLAQSITNVASLIAAAWERAGRPPLPANPPPRSPRPIRSGGR